MKSNWKRYVGCLMMLLVLLVLMPQTARGEEVRKAVHVKAPSDWAAPCVWAWDDDGKNVFDAWPGEEMDKDAANEGWYYIWIPTWANHVIVNANSGGVQTGEQILDGDKEVWIEVADAENAAVGYEKKTTGDTPEYVEKFAIHAKVDESWANPCLWAWSAPDGKNAFAAWPGAEMTASESGWYTAKAPVWVNSIIVNANEGAVQTSDISIDAAEVWVTVDAEGTAEFSYNDPDKAEVANITVHVKAPSDWQAPCLWAWSAPDGTNVFASWPGEPLEEKDGWLTKEVPGWVNSVIVNGNEGGVQTTDISVDAGKDVWLVVSGPEDYDLTYEEPQGGSNEVQEPDTSKDDTQNVGDIGSQKPADEPAKKGGLNPGAIAGIVIAIIAAVGAVIFGVTRVSKK